MKKRLFSVIAITLYVVVGSAQTHNLSQDFSVTANPNGVWSYGYENALGSAFVADPTHYGLNLDKIGRRTVPQHQS